MRLRRYIFGISCIVIFICLFLKGSSRDKLLMNQSQGGLKEYPVVVNEVMMKNRNSIYDYEGDFEGWVEIYNSADYAINLKGFGLSNSTKEPFKWTFPNIEVAGNDFVLVWLSGKNIRKEEVLHTNFKLKASDRTLLFTSPTSDSQDIFAVEKMGENISIGRFPDGSSNYVAFDQGTPEKVNKGELLALGAQTPRLEKPHFSNESGFYNESIQLELTTSIKDAAIYYTVDGTIPTKSSFLYTEPIKLLPKKDEPTIICARTYKEGYPSSDMSAHTYFVSQDSNLQHTLPVISLITDPSNLFDYEKGIYVLGKIYDDWAKEHPLKQLEASTPANYNQRGKLWERPVYLEYFTSEGRLAFSQTVGMRISGGYSRSQPIKSLALHATKTYDTTDVFDYNFFNQADYTPTSSILLRCAGNDYKYSLFRDALIQSLIPLDIKLDTQDSNPCIVFINGVYYGIHNIREAYNKDTLAQTYDMNPEDIVILKNPNGINADTIDEGFTGDEMHYNRLINYIEIADVQSEEAYEFIESQIDIANFIDYTILQIYCANKDWPGNNVRIWRKRTPATLENVPYGHDGRWRWLVYDLDYGFSLYADRYADKSLVDATAVDGPDWPNPPWSTLLLRSLLENESFKNQFINTFSDRLNTIFQPAHVLRQIDEFEKRYEEAIPRHLERWNLHEKNRENWYKEVQRMRIFATYRPTYVKQHIMDYFNLEGIVSVTLKIQEGGYVKLNSLMLQSAENSWTGEYYKDIPITLQAYPLPGYSFSGWEGDMFSTQSELILPLSEDLELEAIFRLKDN